MNKKGDRLSLSKKGGRKKRPDYQWIILIFFLTVAISAVMSFVCSALAEDASIVFAFAALIGIILIGILFDIIGVSVTAADAAPFHSMASRKVPEAQDALMLLRNANRVSSFCNDVIGDVCGVISGSASAVIAARVLMTRKTGSELWMNLIFSALVAGLTVGGKAFGKTFGLGFSTEVVRSAAKVLCFFRTMFHRKKRK